MMREENKGQKERQKPNLSSQSDQELLQVQTDLEVMHKAMALARPVKRPRQVDIFGSSLSDFSHRPAIDDWQSLVDAGDSEHMSSSNYCSVNMFVELCGY